MSNLLSTAETAERLGLSEQSVISLAKSGKLPASFILRRWRFASEDVTAFVASQRRGQK